MLTGAVSVNNLAENPDVVPPADDLLESMLFQVDFMNTKISRLMEVKRQREEVMRMIELFKIKNKEKGGRYSLKEKQATKARHFKVIQVKKDHIRSNQKELYRRLFFISDTDDTALHLNDKYETHSNFSSKVHEKEYVQNRDDCTSMKSLKLGDKKGKKKDKKEPLINKEKDICDTISSKTFKSHGSQEGISVTSNFMIQDYISEESSMDYDDPDHDDIMEEEDEFDKGNNINQLEERKRRLDSELYMLTAVLGPFMDRFGRLTMDMAPHIAMMGHEVQPRNTNNLSNLSLVTQEGSIFSNPNNNSRTTMENQFPEELNRFLNPQAINRNRYQQAVYQNTEEETEPTRPHLYLQNQFLNFEVPVMLTPGELLSTPQRQPALIPNTTVHLHLQAQVPIPGMATFDSRLGSRTAQIYEREGHEMYAD